MATIAEVQAQVHAVDKRVVAVETKMELGFDRLSDEIAKLRDDLSDQGRTPPPVPPAPPKSGAFRLPMPDTMMGYAKVLAVYLPLLGTAYAIITSGTQSAATQAIEDAVEEGRAVPLAAPVLRVLPVPQVVPVPVPQPSIPEPDPVVRPDDLLDYPEPR